MPQRPAAAARIPLRARAHSNLRVRFTVAGAAAMTGGGGGAAANLTAAAAAQPAAVPTGKQPPQWTGPGWCWRRVSRLMNHRRDWEAVESFYRRLVAGDACLSDIGLAPAGQPAAAAAYSSAGAVSKHAPSSPAADKSTPPAGTAAGAATQWGTRGSPRAVAAAALVDSSSGDALPGTSDPSPAPSRRSLRRARQRESGARAAATTAAAAAAAAAAPPAALGDANGSAGSADGEEGGHQAEEGTGGIDGRQRHAATREARPKGRSKNDRTTYRLTLAYYGPAFNGWMEQPDGGDWSVQGELSRALAPLLGAALPPLASGGRTDRGVSAVAQCASFASWHDLGPADFEAAARTVAARAAARLGAGGGRHRGVVDSTGKAAGDSGSGGTSSVTSSSSAEGRDAGAGMAEAGPEALPPFRILGVDRVPRTFHATWSAEWRRYVYLFPLRDDGRHQHSGCGRNSGTKGDLCAEGVCAGCGEEWLDPAARAEVDGIDVDPGRVDALLRALEGRALDYHAYGRVTPKGHPTVCTLHTARTTIVTLPAARPGVETGSSGGSDGVRVLCVELVGDRFLRRMVRVIMSTALRESIPAAAVVACAPTATTTTVPASSADVATGSNGSSSPLVHLCKLGERRMTGFPAPPVGLCFAAVGGEGYNCAVDTRGEIAAHTHTHCH